MLGELMQPYYNVIYYVIDIWFRTCGINATLQ